ncbi:hypothetical protein OAN21_01945 [Alphaproteobacteria bacterium]|nr:hypothetical protein [Alphaproteobacteria bacterium]
MSFVLCAVCSWGAVDSDVEAGQKTPVSAWTWDRWDDLAERYERPVKKGSKGDHRALTLDEGEPRLGGKKKKKQRRVSLSDLSKEGGSQKGGDKKKRSFSSSAIGSWRK